MLFENDDPEDDGSGPAVKILIYLILVVGAVLALINLPGQALRTLRHAPKDIGDSPGTLMEVYTLW